jgi:hypothetical protein
MLSRAEITGLRPGVRPSTNAGSFMHRLYGDDDLPVGATRDAYSGRCSCGASRASTGGGGKPARTAARPKTRCVAIAAIPRPLRNSYRACPLWQPVALAVASRDYQLMATGFVATTFFLQIRFSCKSPTKPRVDERTRTADLSSLHVNITELQGFARTCKAGIFRRLSFLRLALCCTVLRSRWCQSCVRGSYHLSDWWAGVGRELCN